MSKPQCPRCMNTDVEFLECVPVRNTLEEWYSCPNCGTGFKQIYTYVKTEINDELGD